MNFCQLNAGDVRELMASALSLLCLFTSNRSARAFVSDALSAIYTCWARGHACVRCSWIQSGFTRGLDGREKWLSSIHDIYILFSWKSLKELRPKISMTLIRILTCLSTWLDNSRALNLCFNYFDSLFDIYTCGKIRKLLIKLVLFIFIHTEIAIRSKKKSERMILLKLLKFIKFYWNLFS